ncbi:MAG: BamA/TamA family outer membrane protein, partial [Candidatus Eisenbacteria bacterium]
IGNTGHLSLEGVGDDRRVSPTRGGGARRSARTEPVERIGTERNRGGPRRRAWARAARLLLLLLLLASPAGAYEPRTLASTPIRKLVIDGNKALSDKEILSRMEKSRGGWFRSGRYRPRWLEKDLEQVIHYYRSLGFLDARAAETQVAWSGDRRTVDVRVVLDEGPRTLLDAIRIEGLPDVPLEQVLGQLALREGSPYNREFLGRDRARIQTVLAERGYPDAAVEEEERIEGARARLVFRVDSGPRVRIGPIVATGTDQTRERFVVRELTFREGDWFHRGSLLDSRDRIYRTGLYSNVAIVREPLTAENTVPIRIEVREKNVRSFGVGGGFGTEDRFRTSVDWSNRNWLRTGRRLALEVVYSDLYSDRPIEHRYEISLIEPWMFGTRTVGLWKIAHQRLNIENFVIKEDGREDRVVGRYRLNETTASLSLSREFSKIAKGWITYSFEYADAGDPTEPVDPALLEPDVTRSLGLSAERDGRDHLLDPSRGTRVHANTEFAGSVLGGDNEFLKGVIGGTAYRSAGGRTVLAGRLQAGALRSLAAGGTLPDYKRFRLGGANTVRGYREDTIGPGDHLLLLSIELRFRLFWRFGGVLFADGGNAWEDIGRINGADFRLTADAEETSADDFRYGAGAGLRLYTPVGPLRLDYARKLKPRVEQTGDREPDSVFHFSIGQAF